MKDNIDCIIKACCTNISKSSKEKILRAHHKKLKPNRATAALTHDGISLLLDRISLIPIKKLAN